MHDETKYKIRGLQNKQGALLSNKLSRRQRFKLIKNEGKVYVFIPI